jgi:hypothetical protein
MMAYLLQAQLSVAAYPLLLLLMPLHPVLQILQDGEGEIL